MEAQLERYARLGYQHAEALDMLTAYELHIPVEERQRCVPVGEPSRAFPATTRTPYA